MARLRILPAQHPGVVLRRLMDHHKINARRLALDLKIPPMRVSKLLACDRAVTADTALRLGWYFGNGAEYWTSLQSAYDIDRALAKLDGTKTYLEDLPQIAKPRRAVSHAKR